MDCGRRPQCDASAGGTGSHQACVSSGQIKFVNRERSMTLFDMKGKVAVITGSTRGIGLAIAERMAEHGAKVVISSRKADVCEDVAKGINGKYGKGTAVAIAANISSKENLQNLVDESNRAFGKI